MYNDLTMHELAVTESILKIALTNAQAHKAHQITSLHLVIGEWSSYVGESVQFYWDFLSKGTIAEGARLEFRRVPVSLVCQNCTNEYKPLKDDFTCPQCGSTQVRIKTGEEFHLESIDVE